MLYMQNNRNKILRRILIFFLDNCYFESMNSILENIDTIRRNKGYSQEYLAMQNWDETGGI